jgi:hypothetical protein
VVHVDVIIAKVGSLKWEDHGQGLPGQKVRPKLKSNQGKKSKSTAQL